MMRPSFLQGATRPLMVAMITERTPEACIASMRNAIYDGADAFGVMLGCLEARYRGRAELEQMFAYAADKPILVMHYRHAGSGLSDDDLVASLRLAVEAGASMVDIMGDMYDPSPLELATSPATVDKQRRLVDDIHAMGGAVLMSSHTWVYMTAEETIAHAQALASRGADMVKIAMCAHDEDQLLEVIRTTVLLKRELDVPFLHVCMGQYGKMHRVISAVLGSSLVLCVPQYTATSHREQPLLRAAKAVLDNLDWHVARDDQLGAIRSQAAWDQPDASERETP